VTCIIGLVENGTIYMGGDSAASFGWEVRITQEPKVFKHDGMVIGFCGSPRMGQLLHYKLTMTPRPEGISDISYLVGFFAEDVRNCLKMGGLAEIDNNVETGGDFLVGYRGRLYTVGNDYQVLQMGNLNAIGNGREYALGAMVAQSHEKSPTERIEMALACTAEFCASVRSPFIIEELEEIT
jgi:ATP-dependent protease HslVU (ClpYQ) peptidase subunit